MKLSALAQIPATMLAVSIRRLALTPPAITAALAVLFAVGCGSSGSSGSRDSSPTPLLKTDVVAATGGTFMVDGGELIITIPAGALSEDAVLEVYQATGGTLADTMSAAGDAYELRFDNDATLTDDIKIQVALDFAPTHPELAEVAVYKDDQWQRANANFYRASDMMVVTMTQATMIQPVLRRLQKTDGDGVARGQNIFMDETFGNEDFFGGVLGLHELLNGLDPSTAVSVGAQVDLTKVPQAIVDVLLGDDFEAKQAALANPAITRALIKADAVIGVRGFYDDPDSDMMTSAGITCALCHVNVAKTDFELSAGELTALPIGAPSIDGIPNTAMNAGTILSLTPFVQAAGEDLVATLQGWGPGRFDIRALPDNVLDDGVDNPTDTPPLWNFVDLDEQNYAYDWDGLFITGEDDLALASQAEAVYDLVMHANGAFGTSTGTVPPQLAIPPPEELLNALADAEAGAPGNDIDEQSLRDIQMFQRSIVSPAPMAFDEALAETGFELFNGKAQCAGCHSTPEFTGPVLSSTIVLNAPQGGLAGGIKTPGLRGVAYTAPFFHDGSAQTLEEVMDIYSGRTTVELSSAEKTALVEYMKSL
ncbi:MAG TPA: hypothetical protein VIC26_01750 [Marinagarivorans sp.]